MRLRNHAVASALVAALCLAGCEQPPIEADLVTEPIAGPLRPAAERPTPDPNTVIWALSEAPVTLDPARAAIDTGGLQVAAQVYDRLFTLQRERPFQLGAGVAEDWDVDTSGKTYTFTIRDGLRFHDGTPLDAPAVKWNFERWMDPNHPGHIGDFRAWRSMFGGASEAEDDSGRTPNLVQRVEALDAQTVRITLNAPFAPFLNHLAMVPFGIASPKAVEEQGERYGSDGSNLPVGSGPFSVVEWDPENGEVMLAAFEAYHSGPPASPSLRFVTVPDVAERIGAVTDGLAHAADLAPSDTISLTLELAPTIRMIPRPARSNAWLMLDHERPPLGQPDVRRAFSLAIDRALLARGHFGAAALPSDQLLVPGMTGFEQELPTRSQDIEAAKQLLTDAGVADGFVLNISVPTTPRPYLPDPVGTGRAVAEMLRAIGIQADVQTDTLRRFLTRRATGRTTAWIIGWELQSPDPDNAWYYHFGPSRVGSEGRYDNRLLFDLLLEAQRTLGSDSRANSYREAARTVREDDPRIFLAAARSIAIVSERLGGFSPGAMGFDDLSTISIALTPGESPTTAPDSATVPTETGTDAAAGTEAAPVEGSESSDVRTAAPLGTETIAAP